MINSINCYGYTTAAELATVFVPLFWRLWRREREGFVNAGLPPAARLYSGAKTLGIKSTTSHQKSRTCRRHRVFHWPLVFFSKWWKSACPMHILDMSRSMLSRQISLTPGQKNCWRLHTLDALDTSRKEVWRQMLPETATLTRKQRCYRSARRSGGRVWAVICPSNGVWSPRNMSSATLPSLGRFCKPASRWVVSSSCTFSFIPTTYTRNGCRWRCLTLRCTSILLAKTSP